MTIDPATAAIHLVGGAPLASCTFDYAPKLTAGTGTITWNAGASAGCAKYVKGSS
jgi:hypothetical protein